MNKIDHRRIKSQQSFETEQKVVLPAKVFFETQKSQFHRPIKFFWPLPTKKDPTADQSDQEINKLVEFLTKKLNMSNIFRRPIRGLFGRPDKSF